MTVAEPTAPTPGGSLAHAPAADAEAWRTGILDELHGLLVATVPVDALLDAIVRRAADRGGPGSSAAITVRLEGQSTVAAAADERAAACDRAEQAAGDGPCLEAARVGRRITVPDVAGEQRWPAWRAETVRVGFLAAAALPATVVPRSALELAIDLYRTTPGEWDEDVLDDVARLADDAARAVVVASRAEEQARLNTDLRQAMASRAVIDQALGVVMAQNRCGPEEAFAILRRASQHRNSKMRDVAGEIVAQVSGAQAHSPHEFRDRPRS